MDKPRTLEADNVSIIKWWVDESYAVHPDIYEEPHWWHDDTWERGNVRSIDKAQSKN